MVGPDSLTGELISNAVATRDAKNIFKNQTKRLTLTADGSGGPAFIPASIFKRLTKPGSQSLFLWDSSPESRMCTTALVQALQKARPVMNFKPDRT